MNRPKSTRKMIQVKPDGLIPARTKANNKKKFAQPKGYYEQTVTDFRFNHAARHAEAEMLRQEQETQQRGL